jgi:hypothetical protein
LKTDDEIVFAYNSPCAGTEWLFSLYKEQECVDAPLTFGFDAAAFCECPGYEPTYDDECSLCGEGKVVKDKTAEWTDPRYGTWNCGKTEEFAQFFSRTGACTQYLDPAREQCGCVDSGAFSLSLGVSFMMAGVLVIKSLFL